MTEKSSVLNDSRGDKFDTSSASIGDGSPRGDELTIGRQIERHLDLDEKLVTI